MNEMCRLGFVRCGRTERCRRQSDAARRHRSACDAPSLSSSAAADRIPSRALRARCRHPLRTCSRRPSRAARSSRQTRRTTITTTPKTRNVGRRAALSHDRLRSSMPTTTRRRQTSSLLHAILFTTPNYTNAKTEIERTERTIGLLFELVVLPLLLRTRTLRTCASERL